MKQSQTAVKTNVNQAVLIKGAIFLTALALIAGGTAVFAAEDVDSELTQEITAGALATDIRDENNDILTDPAFSLDSVSVSTSQQTTAGVFGTNSQRIAVDNPAGADDGWTLSLAATNPSSEWEDGSNSYRYDGSASQGRLTVDPSTGSITAIEGSTSGVSTGSSASFNSGNAIELMAASSSADNIWLGYLTGVELTQTIPASQPAGDYSLDMTQTVVAN